MAIGNPSTKRTQRGVSYRATGIASASAACPRKTRASARFPAGVRNRCRRTGSPSPPYDANPNGPTRHDAPHASCRPRCHGRCHRAWDRPRRGARDGPGGCLRQPDAMDGRLRARRHGRQGGRAGVAACALIDGGRVFIDYISGRALGRFQHVGNGDGAGHTQADDCRANA